ncbi:DUF2690 domain-containing protein [Kitasatospora sp. NPDC089797]|uniref:DUF2690 domain-containing protein n=1 Tax=Kitasatospora sp. NPDC089797 TaxID=3155298 RepID=UPI0034411F5F
MSQSWKPLPGDLSEPARRLAEELRAVKDAHGISLAELGKRTYLSKASWERWLNGKRLITSQALAGLTAAFDCDAELLTSLLRQAEAAARGPAEAPVAAAEAGVEAGAGAGARPGAEPLPEQPRPQPVPAADPVPAVAPATLPPAADPVRPADRLSALARAAGWRRPQALLAFAVVAVLVLVASLYLHGLNGDGSAAAAPARTPAASGVPTVASMESLPAPLCRSVGCVGKDPETMGCEADDRTLLTGNIGKVVLYVHYSPRCRAAWAGIAEGSPGNTATITTSTGGQESTLIHWGYDNYSKMVDAGAPGITLRVCGHQQDGDGCTGLVTDPAAWAASNTPAPAVTTPAVTTPSAGAPPTAAPVSVPSP